MILNVDIESRCEIQSPKVGPTLEPEFDWVSCSLGRTWQQSAQVPLNILGK
jgi:hypothetical protein